MISLKHASVIVVFGWTTFSCAMHMGSEAYKKQLRLAYQKYAKAEKELMRAQDELFKLKSGWRDDMDQLRHNNTQIINLLREPYVQVEREIEVEFHAKL